MGGNRISVLLVDDNATFLGIATRFLRGQEDIVVVGAVQDREEALRQARELRPDVVLFDSAVTSLPEGLEFVPRLREVLPDTRVIALALLGTDGYRRLALEAGVDEFVPKADMVAELLPAIRRLGKNRRAVEQEPSPTETRPER